MDDAQAQQTNPLFGIIPKEFFTPLASPNRLVYWDCLCRLFQAMSAQLSFGIEREILVDELQFYFEQNQAAEFEEDDINGMDSRKKQMRCCAYWRSTAGLRLRRIRVMCRESIFMIMP